MIPTNMKKVEGGDYSMEYMYEDQEVTVTGTLSDFYICPVEVTNKLWDAVMGWRPEGQTNNGRDATLGFRIVLR